MITAIACIGTDLSYEANTTDYRQARLLIQSNLSLGSNRYFIFYWLVQMQAMKEDPPADFKCKDKFLVQSVAITAEREQIAPADLVNTHTHTRYNNARQTYVRVIFVHFFCPSRF